MNGELAGGQLGYEVTPEKAAEDDALRSAVPVEGLAVDVGKN